MYWRQTKWAATPPPGAGRLPSQAVYSTDSHDDFQPQLKGEASKSVADQIREDVSTHPVFIYMKARLRACAMPRVCMRYSLPFPRHSPSLHRHSPTLPRRSPTIPRHSPSLHRISAPSAMQGQPERPMCGFSNMACRILDAHDVAYGSRDVLSDPELREGIKHYTHWPTIPQVLFRGGAGGLPGTGDWAGPRTGGRACLHRRRRLGSCMHRPTRRARPRGQNPPHPNHTQVFIGGEFIGGSDILYQMHQDGELEKQLEAALKTKTAA